MKIIFLIMLGLSLMHAEFLRENSVVLDTQTKLMWQDDAVGAAATWEVGVQRCEELTLASYDDWRLPTINELRSIINRTKTYPSIVDGFIYTDISYWSSTIYVNWKDYAWYAAFNKNKVGGLQKSTQIHVRCVRAGE